MDSKGLLNSSVAAAAALARASHRASGRVVNPPPMKEPGEPTRAERRRAAKLAQQQATRARLAAQPQQDHGE